MRILSILKLKNLSSTKKINTFTTKHMEVRNTKANIPAPQWRHCCFSICFYSRLRIGICQMLWRILPEKLKLVEFLHIIGMFKKYGSRFEKARQRNINCQREKMTAIKKKSYHSCVIRLAIKSESYNVGKKHKYY